MATTTNVSPLKINYLTQEQYNTALTNNNINADELYLTPISVTSAIEGGTGQSSWAKGDLLYASAANTLSKLNATNDSTKYFLSCTSQVPSWATLSASDIPTISITDKTSGTLTAARGGTGIDTYTIGDILYSNASNSLSKLSGNTTTTRKFLRSVASTSGTAVAPAWDTVTKTDVGLSNVENTALSTWAGTNKITTVGTISAGTWQGTAIAANYIGNHSTDKLTSGTLPVGRGGTGQTSIANIQAGKDGDGNTISSTYLKLSGGTLTGNLIVGQASDTTERQVMAYSAAGRIYLYAQGSATGSKGIYSYNASGTVGGILAVNQSNQISSLADISTTINVVNGGITIGTMADTVQRAINIRSKTGRIVLYTGTSYKGFYASSAPTTDAPNGIGKDIIRINNDNDVDSLTYFKVPVQIKSANNYSSTPSSGLTTELIHMYDSNLGIYHRIYSSLGTDGSKTLFMMTREPGSELNTYVQFGVKLNSDGSPDFVLSAKNNGTFITETAQTSFRNAIGASYTYSFTGTQSKATIINKLNTELGAGEVAVVCLTTTSMRNLTGSTTISGYFKGTVVKETSMLDFFLCGVAYLYVFRINISTQAISDAKTITLNNWTIS